jgi:lipoprotein-releasing system permease protein
MNGEYDPEAMKALVRQLAGKYVTGVTATVEVHAILSYRYGGDFIPHPIMLVGIDPETKSEVGPLVDYLQSYQPKTDDEGTQPAERTKDDPLTWELTKSAMAYRIRKAENFVKMERLRQQMRAAQQDGADKEHGEDSEKDIFDSEPTEMKLGELQKGRLFIGVGQATYLQQDPETGKQKTIDMIRPGDDVKISTVSAGNPSPVHFDATVVDTFRTGMSEYDSNLVYCNIEYLQYVRKMLRASDNVGAVTSLQIKLKDYKDAPKVVEILRGSFTPENFVVKTWEQRQGPLLAAVDVESSILNILLFLIITVAGFGILAIFFMIVVEKTRDIGILKALGASSSGVMSIFLAYGLLLGMVGAGAGVCVGLLFVHYINEIEAVVSFLTGREVFPETIYYFKDIPTHVDPFTVAWVSFGAVLIAVLASVLPARRASQLRPVQALRYE